MQFSVAFIFRISLPVFSRDLPCQFFNSHLLQETSTLSLLSPWNLLFLAFYKSTLLLFHKSIEITIILLNETRVLLWRLLGKRSCTIHCAKQAARQQTLVGNLRTPMTKPTQLCLFGILLCFVVTSVFAAYLEKSLIFINTMFWGFFPTCFFPLLNITNTFLLISVIIQTAKEQSRVN